MAHSMFFVVEANTVLCHYMNCITLTKERSVKPIAHPLTPNHCFRNVQIYAHAQSVSLKAVRDFGMHG